jgi:hypothetical protein
VTYSTWIEIDSARPASLGEKGSSGPCNDTRTNVHVGVMAVGEYFIGCPYTGNLASTHGAAFSFLERGASL